MGLGKGLSVGGTITTVILIVILFAVLVEVVPIFGTSTEELSTTNITTDTPMPFASFFAGDGILPLIFIAGIILAVVAYFGFGKTR